MAVLDTQRNEVVIRVVYDGPPEAGKTTSVRALATSFSQQAYTPEETPHGRTQWFDWMEYVGGRFEGAQIRCQIVTVPGQRELDRRRQALLASADVIVFVGDTTAERWETSLEYLFELASFRNAEHSPVGIVFQANKRDVAGAVPLADIRSRLGDARWEVGIVESVAADGTGIREAFVYAVRLALDRVRDLVSRGKLVEAPPAEASADQLLALLRFTDVPRGDNTDDDLALDPERFAFLPDDIPALPPPPDPPREPATTIEASVLGVVAIAQAAARPRVESSTSSVAATLLRDVLAAEVGAAPVLPPIPRPPRDKLVTPRPPDASVPSGAIWPPVEGRAILVEVTQLELHPRRHANGDWSAGLGSGWRLMSKRDALFESLDAGRSALVEWARLHAACTSVVSPRRCIVLAATGDGRWRLWQIVRAEESLRTLFERASTANEPEAIAESLCQTAQLLVEVNERIAHAPCELPVSLDTVGACEASGMYIGLMPETPTEPIQPRTPPSALVAKELGPMVALELSERRDDIGRVLQRRPKPGSQADPVIATLQRIFE